MYQKIKILLKSSSTYTVGNIINRSLFLISMPIMTRYLAPNEYGTLSLVNAVVAIMSTCYGLGITSYVMRHYYECNLESEKKRFMGTIISFIIVLSLIVSIFFSLFGGSFFPKLFKDIQFSPYILLGVWICFVSMFEILPDVLFRIKDQAVLFISLKLSKSILRITLSIIAVVLLQRGAEGPLTASLIVASAFVLFYIWYLKDKIQLNFSFPIISDCLKFSLPVLFLLLGRVMLDSADRLILQRFVELSVVAFYSVGSSIGSVLVMIASSINSAWSPFFYATAKEESEAKAKEVFSYASLYMGTLMLFLGLCPVIFRYEIIYILAPPTYYPIIDIIPYIIIAATFNALFFIPVRGIYQQKKTGRLPIIILTSLIINIILNFILIPKYQMRGAALATIVASFVMFTMCFFTSQKLYRIPYQYSRFLKVLLTCVICFLLSLITSNYPLILSIVLKCFIILLFPLFLFLLRFFEARELDKISQLLTEALQWLGQLFRIKRSTV